MNPRRLRYISTSVLAFALLASAPAAAYAGPEQETAAAEGAAAHGEEEHEAEFNWMYGFFGEKEGVEPSIAFRRKGMPAPFLANIINAAVLFGLIGAFGKKPVVEGLKKRKERIVKDMEEAGKMKAEASVRLAEYEHKIEHLDGEIERIRREMREAAEADRARILTEAKERRDRMERDAKILVEQEIKAAREALVRETVTAALAAAEQLIAKEVAAADHDRIAKDYLEGLRKSAGSRGVSS